MELSFQNVDQVCAGVDLTANQPLLDLSQVTFFRPFAVIYLGMFLRYHNLNGKSFRVTLPMNATAKRYLSQQNFWTRFNFNPESIESQGLSRFSSSTSLGDVIDIERRDGIAEEIENKILAVLIRNGVKTAVNLVAESMCELIDNFAAHAKRNFAAVAMQYYPNLHEVVFAIGDCGIGVRASLASNPKYEELGAKPHYEAAARAFEPLVSCRPEGGTGLTEVREQVVRLEGGLILTTGDGFVTIDKKGETRVGQMAYELPGVQVQLSYPEMS